MNNTKPLVATAPLRSAPLAPEPAVREPHGEG